MSDERGKYHFINLKPGWYQVRCYTSNGYVYYRQSRHGRMEGSNLPTFQVSNPQAVIIGEEGEVLEVKGDKTLKGIDFHFAPFKKGTWRNYTYFDGLANNEVTTLYCDRDGFLWFGTMMGGVCRYDGERFFTFTTNDGLVDNSVMSIYQDTDGVMWFGTWGGISRYDGKKFINFTTQDGLADNRVSAIYQDADGALWFGTRGGGVCRYDGEQFVTFTIKNGLADNHVMSICQDADGALWFGTESGGVSRYDGKTFVTFTTVDGLADT
ncbi:hypothetical protein HYR99_01870 [Candidatus Poribacteria bacterium]|nr:hypothetical protein [Candidatus Poribacteria bacterium]